MDIIGRRFIVITTGSERLTNPASSENKQRNNNNEKIRKTISLGNRFNLNAHRVTHVDFFMVYGTSCKDIKHSVEETMD